MASLEDATLREKFEHYKHMSIHMAVQRLNFDAVRTLLSVNESLLEKLEERTQDSPLHIAVSVGSYEMVMYLLGWGADCNVQNRRGRTALMSAVRGVHGEVRTQKKKKKNDVPPFDVDTRTRSQGSW